MRYYNSKLGRWYSVDLLAGMYHGRSAEYGKDELFRKNTVFRVCCITHEHRRRDSQIEKRMK